MFDTPSLGPPCVTLKDKTLDYGAATLALVDVGSDAIVTKQYWDDAQSNDDFPMFFTLSCGIICMSSMASFWLCMICMSRAKEHKLPGWVTCVFLLGVVPPFGIFLPPLLWRYETIARDRKPEPKLPLKVVVSASGEELFAKGRAVLDVSAAKADEAKVEAGPYQVLMVARKPPYEAQEKHLLLRGDWIERSRNTAPMLGNEGIARSIVGLSELSVQTKTFSGNVVVQSLDWTADQEAWKVTSTRQGEDAAGRRDRRWALPPRVQLRMLHPNAIEVYLLLKGVGGVLGKVVISYLFRESEYFEPLRDESLTLETYQAWLGQREEQDSNLLVWLGTRDAPVAPPRPLAADGAGIDAAHVRREWKEWQEAAVTFYFSEHLPFINELTIHDSEKLQQKIRTQAPFLVETIFEAIPQSLLQASAMVIYSEGRPEDISIFQLTSVGISVTSLLAKIYVACDSMVPQMFFFKGACLCFDLVCLFYTFTALWAARRDDPDAVQVFFLTRPVDWASAIYVWTVAAEVIVLELQFVACMCSLIKDEWNKGDCCDHMIYVVIATIFVILAPLPICILVMSVRMSWVVAMIFMAEVRFSKNTAFYRQAFAFVHGGADVHARIKAVNHALLGVDTSGQGTSRPSTMPSLAQILLSLVAAIKGLGGTIQEIASYMMNAEEPFRKRCLTLLTLLGALVAAVLALVAAVFAGLAVIYSMVYPHLTFGIANQKRIATGRPLNPFSLYLYIFLSLFFLLAVSLSPVVWRFLRFATLVHVLDKQMASEDEKLQEVREVYAEHYETTSQQQQQEDKQEEEEEEEEEEEQQQQQQQAPTVYGNIISL